MAKRTARWRISPGLSSAVLVSLCACDPGGGGLELNVVSYTFEPLATTDTLQAADVDAIVGAAAASVDFPNLSIAVVDRLGNLLRLYNRTPSGAITAGESLDVENKFALATARASAYLSHSQAPLTSRTGQFLSTFHFPGVFATGQFINAPPLVHPGFTPPVNPTLGVQNTPQAPLWQIDASNRGGMDQLTYNLGAQIPRLVNPDGTVPTPGLGPLPGAVPLYKSPAAAVAGAKHVTLRCVGAIGVYAWDTAPTGALADPRPDVMEFVALNGAGAPLVGGAPGQNYAFPGVPPEGAVYLVGILLPAFDPPVQPAGTLPGSFDPLDVVCPGDPSCVQQADGSVDPFGDLVGPLDSTDPLPSDPGLAGLSAVEVAAILQGCVTASQQTHAAIRLPADAACQMVISVCDLSGTVIGAFRETDATLFSLEISVSKARNAVFFSHPDSINTDPASPLLSDGTPTLGRHPLSIVFDDPLFGDFSASIAMTTTGVATTARSLGFLSQPFFPPVIDSSAIVGPLHELALTNRDPSYFDCQGYESDPALGCTQRSGIIFFPGSAPLYKTNSLGAQQLVGGIGVSGDGVEQDDYVTSLGIQLAELALGQDLEPPVDARIDNFSYAGVKIPYFKFPQTPGG